MIASNTHRFFYKTGRMDWIHHVPVYILNTLMFSVRAGDVILLQALVMTGIPGGLDYLLQVLEGEGRMTRAAYKEWCGWINNWIRAPFGALSSYVCALGLWHAWGEASTWQRVVLTLMAAHAYWNPPFFSRQAIEANVVDVVNRFCLDPGSIKLPAVRALSGKPAGTASAEPKKKPTKEPKEEPKKRVDAYPIGEADAASCSEASKETVPLTVSKKAS